MRGAELSQWVSDFSDHLLRKQGDLLSTPSQDQDRPSSAPSSLATPLHNPACLFTLAQPHALAQAAPPSLPSP